MAATKKPIRAPRRKAVEGKTGSTSVGSHAVDSGPKDSPPKKRARGTSGDQEPLARATDSPGAPSDFAQLSDPNGFVPTSPRGRRTRAALVAAGRLVFEEVGFADARIDHICEGAQVSHGTFYVYFDSKEALFREVVHIVVGEVFAASRLGATESLDEYDRIEVANRRYLRAWRQNATILRVLDQVSSTNLSFRQLLMDLREDFHRRTEDALVRLQDAGVMPREPSARLMAITLGAMSEQFAHLWVAFDETGEEISEDDGVAALTTIWARSVGLENIAGQPAKRSVGI